MGRGGKIVVGMHGTVLQVSVSNGGLPKYPIAEGEVTPLGLAADGHRNMQVHGGPRKALLLATAEGIDELTAAGFELYPGALGENITTQGLDRRRMRPGQRYRIGEVVVEITKLREPCSNLLMYGESLAKAVYDPAVHAGKATSPRWGLGGFYASVIHPGTVRAGDPIVLLDEAA